MRKAVVMMLLAVASSSVMADWVEMFSDADGNITYTDPATIRRAGDTTEIWDMTDFKKVQLFRVGEKYRSIMKQHEYDCTEARWRLLAIFAYANSMGKGEVVASDSNPDSWAPLVPGSREATIWKVACAKK